MVCLAEGSANKIAATLVSGSLLEKSFRSREISFRDKLNLFKKSPGNMKYVYIYKFSKLPLAVQIEMF
jgi:hypothetical protein